MPNNLRHLSLALVGGGAVLLLISLCFGPTILGPVTLIKALLGFGDPIHVTIVQDIRLPRMVLALTVGAALGLAGSALQGLLRNPVAEPGLLGVSASGALSTAFCFYTGLMGAVALPIAGAAGAGAAVFILAVVAATTKSTIFLLLVGIGINAISGALMMVLVNFAPNPFSLADLMSWTLGSVANRSASVLWVAGPMLIAGAGILLRHGRALSALTLGDATAQSMGVDVRRLRTELIIGTGILSGVAVSIAGAIGFVGLVAPHMVRAAVGYSPQRALLPSALAGAVLLGIADLAVRLIPTSQELRLGVFIALIGAPLFLLIIAREGARLR